MTALPEMLTIGMLAQRSGIATSALRYYDAEGLIESERSEGGQRRYHRSALRRVAFVLAAREIGLTLPQIRGALASLPGRRTPTREDWQRLTRRWRPQLEARIAALEAIRDRLDGCIGCGCLSLDICPLYNDGDKQAHQGPGARRLITTGLERPARGTRGRR